MSRLLATAGHEVSTAQSRSEAVEKLTAGPAFDLFILDFWIGGDTGVDVMRDLRKSQPDAPMLFLSGGNEMVALETSTALAEMQGAAEFLYKPVEKNILLDAVARHTQ